MRYVNVGLCLVIYLERRWFFGFFLYIYYIDDGLKYFIFRNLDFL